MKTSCTYVLALLLVSLPTIASAQPGAATLIAPSGDVATTTIAFTWQSVPTATWYHLWIAKTDGSVVLERWYTAEQTACPTAGTCTVTVTPPVVSGPHLYYVQAWSGAGYGPWSAANLFTVKSPTQTWSATVPPSRRFTLVLNNAAVLDNETGLVWQRTLNTDTWNFPSAQLQCWSLNLGERGGWRIPTAAEIRTVVDPTRANPALSPGHPFNLPDPQGSYWSNSTAATNYLLLQMSNGQLGLAGIEQNPSGRLWCVRAPE